MVPERVEPEDHGVRALVPDGDEQVEANCGSLVGQLREPDRDAFQFRGPVEDQPVRLFDLERPSRGRVGVPVDVLPEEFLQPRPSLLAPLLRGFYRLLVADLEGAGNVVQGRELRDRGDPVRERDFGRGEFLPVGTRSVALLDAGFALSRGRRVAGQTAEAGRSQRCQAAFERRSSGDSRLSVVVLRILGTHVAHDICVPQMFFGDMVTRR